MYGVFFLKYILQIAYVNPAISIGFLQKILKEDDVMEVLEPCNHKGVVNKAMKNTNFILLSLKDNVKYITPKPRVRGTENRPLSQRFI